MRKALLLFLILNATLTMAQYVDVNAVEIPVGYYVSKGDKKTVYTFTSSDTAEVKAVAIVPEVFPNTRMDMHEKRLVIPYSTGNLERLKQIKDKYAEWSLIAVKEKAPMMMKTIDIEIPDMYILTYKIASDKPRHDDYHIALKSKRFKFAVPAKADMMPMLHFIIDGKDPSRESSDVYGSHAFYSVSEFEELLNLIAPDGLKEKIKNKTIDKLFR